MPQSSMPSAWIKIINDQIKQQDKSDAIIILASYSFEKKNDNELAMQTLLLSTYKINAMLYCYNSCQLV